MKAKKLPSGSYRTQVIVGYDEYGKRTVKSFTADTAEEAIRLALDFKATKALCIVPRAMTVEQAFSQYIGSGALSVHDQRLHGHQGNPSASDHAHEHCAADDQRYSACG